jgi:SAM-dependent methyltransferase
MAHAGVTFDPVIGDSERLPFPPETFDWVFGAAVLHHTADLAGVVRNAFRVLKPGGRLIAVNEPCIGVNEDPRAVLARDAKEELAFGINESRPNYLDYFGALLGAGFEDIDVIPLAALGMDDVALEGWAIALGALPGRGAPGSARGFGRALLDRARRWLAVRRAQGRLPRPRSRREALLRAILIHSGGGVIVLARKPS